MIKLLILLVVVLAVVMIAQLVRVFELSTELRGGSQNEVTEKDNKMNATLMLVFMFVFFAACIWQFIAWKDYLLPESASVHGLETDALLNFNFVIIIFVFFVTEALLFIFAFKYYAKKDNKATYFAHSNKLEFIWTIIPAIVLTVIIVFGIKSWNSITAPAPENALTIELYAKQFDWTARYTGTDGKLGSASFKLIEGTNSLGLDSTDQSSWDDQIVKGELHIPIDEPVNFVFRSRDVIHSAYMPHFRAQMNCVPGMVTQFHFVPRLTTAQMKEKTGNKDFEYVLLCNKICGAAHWNMQMNIVVDTKEDYLKWLKDQKPFMVKDSAEPVASDSSAVAVAITDSTKKV
jgi:cytochrome c oxidase subunit 2